MDPPNLNFIQFNPKIQNDGEDLKFDWQTSDGVVGGGGTSQRMR